MISVSELVESELAQYQNAQAGENPSSRTDYLLSIVIPVYNEYNTIGRVVSRVAALPLNTEIVLIDDCSTDGTRELLQSLTGLPNIKVILKDKNAGKGAALRTDFEQVTGDYVIVQDADLEYDPRDIPSLIQPLLKGGSGYRLRISVHWPGVTGRIVDSSIGQRHFDWSLESVQWFETDRYGDVL